MNIRELGSKLRSGELSCVQMVEQAVAAAQGKAHLNAFIKLTTAGALAEAAALDRELQSGIDRGPLHGIPIALKDLFYTRDYPTTGGSLLYRTFVPPFDADVVERLRATGAVSIGKTNLHELAFGITSRNPHFGVVLNPLETTRLAGGSSGGSAAAVAAGMVPMALGTDTGGSIRIPASFCGIVGFKPTYGRVSRRGVLPLAFSLDHVGPLGSCVEDCALAMNAIADAGEDFNLPALDDLAGVRIGIPRQFFFSRLEAAVAERVTGALAIMEKLGAALTDVELPDFDEMNVAARVVQLGEFASLHTRTEPGLLGSDVAALLEQGRLLTAHEYINAQRLRTLFRAEMDGVWLKIDLLATPTTPTAAPPSMAQTVPIAGKEEDVRMASTRLVRGFNLLGEPALSMPCGRTAENMPVGLQLVAPPWADARLLQIAKTLERVLER